MHGPDRDGQAGLQELAGSATMLFWEDGPLGVLTTDQLLASRRGANQREERILVEKRAALRKPFDIRPCHGCTLDDLVMDPFSVSRQHRQPAPPGRR